ncbi:MAG TPA: aldose epimerase family protein [Burkholderiaceae bacterium]|nr:aldose epimerase family protein [Burkholderiaceae bacterium]
MLRPVSSQPWGTDPDGKPVELWTLRHPSGAIARISTWGATLTSLRMPLADGSARETVLGFESLDGYLGDHPYIGAAVGRFANRIAHGRFELEGRAYALAANAAGHHLHGGERGLSRRTWSARAGEGALAPGESSAPWLTLSCTSPDGEDGYPGALDVELRYVLDGHALRLDWTATADAPTPVNLTHHAYFNLGEPGGDVLGHRLRVRAERFLPVDAGLIPTGELRPVAGTPMDLRAPRPIGEAIAGDDPQLRAGGGFDHCWVLADAPGPLRPAATLVAPDGALELRMATTEPGVQVYSGNFLDGTLRGPGDVPWPKHGGLCLEAQRFPDSPNRSEFPDTILRPGRVYRQTTVYAFEKAAR